jgi:hypothetical protein
VKDEIVSTVEIMKQEGKQSEFEDKSFDITNGS